MEETNNRPNDTQPQGITAIDLFKTLWQRRKVFYLVLPVTFVLASAFILSVPRYYTCEVALAPETRSVTSSSSLLALASSFGFDLKSMSNEDALYPTLYPMIVESPNFLITLFDTPVTTADGEFKGTYYEYLKTKRRIFFLKRWKYKLKSMVSQKEKEPVAQIAASKNANEVFNLNKEKWAVINIMQSDIVCTIGTKTNVINFSVTAQDKMVCAIMADSVCAALQAFITDYRTIKNRIDIRYYEKVMQDSYLDYQHASEQYVRYMDSHKDMNLEQYRIEALNLENEMQLKYSAYSSFQKQYLATQARMQENTPVFTVLKSASIPLKATGPKRMVFVLAMLILATGITCCVLCRHQLLLMITSNND